MLRATVAGLALLLLLLPLVALIVRAPWARSAELFTSDTVLRALGLTGLTALLATGIVVLLGLPLAALLAEWAEHSRRYRLLRTLVTVPLVLPPVVAGLALLMLLGRRGLLGEPLYALTGLTVPFTTVAVVIAQAFVALPFFVMTVEGTLRATASRHAVVAQTLGATPLSAFWTVTVPRVAPGLVAGTALAFARAVGEFGATITFAGSFPGVTQTLPIATYLELQRDPDAAIAMALLLVAASVIVLLLAQARWMPRRPL